MPLVRTMIIALIVFLIDRVSKWFVVEWLDLVNKLRIEVSPPYLNLTMAWNKGINFGIFGGGNEAMRFLLIGLAVLIIVFLVYWVRNKPSKLITFSVGSIVGGALGNVYDRVSYGAVADFINMSCCGINNPYAFNIADAAIFLGAFLLILFADSETHK